MLRRILSMFPHPSLPQCPSLCIQSMPQARRAEKLSKTGFISSRLWQHKRMLFGWTCDE
jgi:hypothetical protein